MEPDVAVARWDEGAADRVVALPERPPGQEAMALASSVSARATSAGSRPRWAGLRGPAELRRRAARRDAGEGDRQAGEGVRHERGGLQRLEQPHRAAPDHPHRCERRRHHHRHRAAHPFRLGRLFLAQRDHQRSEHAGDAGCHALARHRRQGHHRLHEQSHLQRHAGVRQSGRLVHPAAGRRHGGREVRDGPGGVPAEERQGRGRAQHVGARAPRPAARSSSASSGAPSVSAGRTSGRAGGARRKAVTGEAWACPS